MTDPILFYSTAGEHGCFSNFSRDSIDLDGRVWKTSEHYFQAQKFFGVNEEQFNKIHAAKTPGDAAKLGRDRSVKMRKDWESVKNNVMHKVVHAKFSQNIKLKEILLSTADAKLVEHTSKDSYWGDGGRW